MLLQSSGFWGNCQTLRGTFSVVLPKLWVGKPELAVNLSKSEFKLSTDRTFPVFGSFPADFTASAY